MLSLPTDTSKAANGIVYPQSGIKNGGINVVKCSLTFICQSPGSIMLLHSMKWSRIFQNIEYEAVD